MNRGMIARNVYVEKIVACWNILDQNRAKREL